MLSQKQNSVIMSVLIVLVVILIIVLGLFFAQNQQLKQQEITSTVQIETPSNMVPSQGSGLGASCAQEGNLLSDVADEGPQNCCAGLEPVAYVGQESSICRRVNINNDSRNISIRYDIPELGIEFMLLPFDASDVEYRIENSNNLESSSNVESCVVLSSKSVDEFRGSDYKGSHGVLCRLPQSTWDVWEGSGMVRGDEILRNGDDVITYSASQDYLFGYNHEATYEAYKIKYPEVSDPRVFESMVRDSVKWSSEM